MEVVDLYFKPVGALSQSSWQLNGTHRNACNLCTIKLLNTVCNQGTSCEKHVMSLVEQTHAGIWIHELLNIAHSCSQHLLVTAWLTSEWSGIVTPFEKYLQCWGT